MNKPKRFRSKPVIKEAMRLTADNAGWVLLWMESGGMEVRLVAGGDPDTRQLWVEKSKRWCEIDVGDFVVKELDGVGFYPCKSGIFEATHEELDA